MPSRHAGKAAQACQHVCWAPSWVLKRLCTAADAECWEVPTATLSTCTVSGLCHIFHTHAGQAHTVGAVHALSVPASFRPVALAVHACGDAGTWHEAGHPLQQCPSCFPAVSVTAGGAHTWIGGRPLYSRPLLPCGLCHGIWGTVVHFHGLCSWCLLLHGSLYWVRAACAEFQPGTESGKASAWHTVTSGCRRPQSQLKL